MASREEYDAQVEAHRKANEEAAPFVKDGWLTDLIGGGPLGSSAAICPQCAAYVPNTNVAKVHHQTWHDLLQAAIEAVANA